MVQNFVEMPPDPPEKIFVAFIFADHEPLKPCPYQIVASPLPLTARVPCMTVSQGFVLHLAVFLTQHDFFQMRAHSEKKMYSWLSL